MDGGALFRVHTEASTRVLTEMLEIYLHKNKVNGYAYNDVNTLLTQIERFLEHQLFKDSSDRMKVLASNISNALIEYKSTINIKKRDVLAAFRAAGDLVSTVNPEITKTATTRTKPTDRTSSASQKLASRKVSQRGSPRSSESTSQTPSYVRRTAAISNRCTSTRSINYSQPSQRGRKD